MSTRSDQFLQYLREHGMKFTIERVLEETGMNRNILRKAMHILKKSHEFIQADGVFTVKRKEGSNYPMPKLSGFLVKLFTQLQEKGAAGITPAESGMKATSFSALISMLRSRGYRVDFENNRYYFKGMDDFSLSHRKGGLPPLKIWARSSSPHKKIVSRLPPLDLKEKTPKKHFREIFPTPLINFGSPFTINNEILEESLKDAPKEYASFVKDVVKRIGIANAAYASLSEAKSLIQKVEE